MLQRQGQLGADGNPAAPPRRPNQPPRPTPGASGGRRQPPTQFLREVRTELRRVAWPTRSEVINYSLIVLVTLALIMILIFGLDFLFAKSILFLFKS